MAEETLPNRIRELRDNQHLSLRDLAQKAGVDFNTLGRMERGDQALDYPRMRKIASALGVRISELLVDADVEMRAGETGTAILRELEDIDPALRPDFLAAVKKLVATARAMAAQHSAAALGGDVKQVGQLAEMWGGWDDSTREKALQMLSISFSHLNR